jgi:hypothetical protein
MRLEAFEHLSFNVFDVGEPAPTSNIAVFSCTLDLTIKFFHERPLIPVFFSEMLLANVRNVTIRRTQHGIRNQETAATKLERL